MSGFFNRLAQRTLGTAQTVRPAITPRFSQKSMADNELPVEGFPVADIIVKQNHRHSETENLNKKTQWLNPEHKALQSNRVDNEAINQSSKHNKQQTEQRGENLFELDQKPEYEKKQINFVDKTETLLIHHKFDKEESNKDNSKHLAFSNAPTKEQNKSDLPLVGIELYKGQKKETISHGQDNSVIPLETHQTPEIDKYQQEAKTQQPQHSSNTINVTIGRVEVRAVYPIPSPVIKQSKRTNKTTLTLDDYLQQRQRGER